MANLFYVQYLISNANEFSEKAEKSFYEALEKLIDGEADALYKCIESKTYINYNIDATEKLLKISLENPGIIHEIDHELLKLNLQSMRNNLQRVEEMINLCKKQQVETH